MDKTEKNLYKQLKKAEAHQDEHPLSNSANRDVRIAQAALATYISDKAVGKLDYLYNDMESLFNFSH